MVSEQSVDALRAAVRCLRYRDGGLRDLARRAGVSYSWLTKFATSRTRNEKIDTLRRIARLFPDPLPAPRARSTPVGHDPAGVPRGGLKAAASSGSLSGSLSGPPSGLPSGSLSGPPSGPPSGLPSGPPFGPPFGPPPGPTWRPR